MQRSTSAPSKSFFQPIDRTAIVLMLILSLIIGGLLIRGGSVAPKVREFNWQDRQVGAEDTAFILTFSRPMDYASVEQNLRIDPPLPGKISWAGRRMAYTLTAPAPYGNLYQVQLQGARDRFNQANSESSNFQPFLGRFQSRDRAFVYIGVQGEEEGRLVLYNFTQKQQRILTPKNLVVMEFEPYPLGDRILFSATERTEKPQNGLSQQLYTVTTGIAVKPPKPTDAQSTLFGWGQSADAPRPEDAGKVSLVLDGKNYQNLKFDLSDDGETIVVQRVSLKDPSDSSPWLLRAGADPQPLKGQPGGDFLLTPDSNSLAIAQGQGLAILPLEPDAKPLDFLPKFGMVLGFAKDGSAAAMVKFNNDYTRSLFLVNTQGTQKELLRTTGYIWNAQFDPTKQVLYCLLTNRIPGETYQEEPFLAAIDLKTAKLNPLLRLPNQRDLQISLSPDGLAILFDQTVDTETDEAGTPRNREGKAIVSSRLWVLPLVPPDKNPTEVKPELLPLSGIRPRWLP
jgi:hypothetical protein